MSYRRELPDAEATKTIGESLGRVLRPGDLLGLVGDLGAGKTTFVQGIGLGLEIPAGLRVTSPTFALVNEYRGGRVDLIHADLYRIERQDELDELGLYEACESRAVVVVEWCERFPVLPADHLRVELRLREGGGRLLEATALGAKSSQLLDSWLG